MKGIEFTQSQIKALENGATCFIFPICNDTNEHLQEYIIYKDDTKLIECHAPIQKGEKFFVQEHYFKNGTEIHYVIECEKDTILQADYHVGIIPASQMTYEQSRLKEECVDVRIVRPSQISKTGYFDGADIDKKILKGLGLEWIGYFNRESYEEIGHKLFVDLYNHQMQEQNINRTYENNDYIFLMEIK